MPWNPSCYTSSAGLWPVSPTQTPRTARPFPSLSLACPFELLPRSLFFAPPGAPLPRVGWPGVQQVGCCGGGGWEASSRVRMQSSCQRRQSRLCVRGPLCPASHSQQIQPRTHHLASWLPPSVFVTTNTQELCERKPVQAWRGGGDSGEKSGRPETTPQVYLRTESSHPGYSVPIPGAFATPHNKMNWPTRSMKPSGRAQPALSLCLINKHTGWRQPPSLCACTHSCEVTNDCISCSPTIC